MSRIAALLLASLLSAPLASFGQTDTLKTMFYNVLNFSDTQNSQERAQGFTEVFDRYLPHILSVCELRDTDGADLILNQYLNAQGRDYYERAAYTDDGESSLTENMLYYDSRILALEEQFEIKTIPRWTNIYKLRYRDTAEALENDTVFLYYLVAHFEPSTGTSSEAMRQQQAQDIADFMADHPEAENWIFGADLNIRASDEEAYQTLMGTALADPIGQPGDWHDNQQLSPLHTQSTRKEIGKGGGASGGMDDRYDFLLADSALLGNSHRLAALTATYQALGNDGQRFNGAINTSSPPNNDYQADLLNALFNLSDHLPVVMDMEVDLSQPTALPENSPLRRFKLAVNPGQKALWLRHLQPGRYRYRVLSTNGQVLRQGSRQVATERHRLALEALPAGFYFFQIGNGQHQQVKPFVLTP